MIGATPRPVDELWKAVPLEAEADQLVRPLYRVEAEAEAHPHLLRRLQ